MRTAKTLLWYHEQHMVGFPAVTGRSLPQFPGSTPTSGRAEGREVLRSALAGHGERVEERSRPGKREAGRVWQSIPTT